MSNDCIIPVSDANKLSELHYKKKPILLEFYTESFLFYLGGVLLVKALTPCFKKKSGSRAESLLLDMSIQTKLKNSISNTK